MPPSRGLDVGAPIGGPVAPVGPLAVAAGPLLAGLSGWALLALLERRRTWTVIALVDRSRL